MRSLVTLDDLDHEGLTPDEIFDLEGAYVEAIARTPHAEERYGHFHPSANGSCGRKNVYEYTRVPALSNQQIYKLWKTHEKLLTATKVKNDAAGKTDTTPDVARDQDTLDFGHAAHALILERRLGQIKEMLEERGWTVEIEVEKPHDPNTDLLRQHYDLGGTTDALIRVTDPHGDSQEGVLEVKSSKSKLFHKMQAAKKEHLAQANIYALRWGVPNIWVWYFNKDDSDRRVFRSFFDPVLLEETLGRFAEWKRHADAGTLPERDMNMWICARCPWQTPCNPPILNGGANKAAVARARARGGLGRPQLTMIRRKT